MQTLSVEIMVPQPQIFEIPIPFFSKSKDGNEWVGLLDEKTVVDIFKCGDMTMIRNKSVAGFYTKEDLVKAVKSFDVVTETEFLDHYDKVIESISLTPKIAV